MNFIEPGSRSVIVKGKKYTPITFTRRLEKEKFDELTKTVLAGNNCIYSKDAAEGGIWFCPTDQIGRIMIQTTNLLGEEAFEDDLGVLLAEEYKKAK